MQLYIGNKNYSSWSLRAWLLLRQAGIAFTERQLRLDWTLDSQFKRTLLAIAETIAELHPEKRLWPVDRRQRARARSLCAEMHSGFTALRNRCPMNIEASLPEVGRRVATEWPDVADDLRRIDAMWSEQLEASGGPFLFGEFGIVDAYYAPVCSRARTYALPLGPAAAAYVDRIHALPAMQEWCAAARDEHDFIAEDEPYRQSA